ncbi:MAG: cupin domain-containing protein [Candidatus Omnitrophica bacterium]|nr:cupin domain-containing protein [Candidatus Omnitrophota bacterium]
MKLYEKIRDYRKRVAKLSMREFHKKLVDIFGDKALTYYSLCRLEKGYRSDIRLTSLYQICTGLGISLKELKEGTDQEESKIVTIIKNSERAENRYFYNEKAIAEILSSSNIKFLTMELGLTPGGATKLEEDPVGIDRFEKLVIVLQGEVLCHIGQEKHLIKKGDTLSFASNIPHHFENPSKKIKSRAIIIQNPKSY